MPEFDVRVSGRTETGVQCHRLPLGEAFWLSLASCRWSADPQPGTSVRVQVPEWLALKHRQLAGDQAFETAKEVKSERSTATAEQREMSGVLSRNKNRQTDKHPEFKGSAMIDGTPYWVSAWVKEGLDGKFFSLAFKPKDQPMAQAPSNGKTSPSVNTQLGDEVPF